MEPFISFIIAALMPRWIQRIKKAVKKYTKLQLTGDDIVFIFCLLGAFGYILYVVLFEGIPADASTITHKAFYVFTAFWTGAAGSYGLFYKYYFKKPDEPEQSTETEL